jgi:hypothetical protein
MNDRRIVPVFQILAEDIHALGIRTVFGLMSDDTAVFAVTLDGLGVKFVGGRHENNAYTIRTLDELRALGPVLGKPEGPILLDCKVNADIAAPFMGEFAEFEARHQST